MVDISKAGVYEFDPDFVVNRLGFGAMQLTGAGVWGPYPDPKHAVEVILAAADAGVNFMDTADSYGPWYADQYLTKALSSANLKQPVFISDKVGQTRQGPNQWTPLGNAGYLRQQVEVSLMQSGRDHEDLLFLHRIDKNFSIEEQVGELAKLQKEGKIKHIGLSQVSVDQIKEAQKYAKIDAIENLYNIEDHHDDDVVEYAQLQGMAFVPWFPLATGKILSDQGPLADVAKKYNASPAQIALAWLLKRSPNIIPIPGTASIEHLHDNIASVDVQLSDQDFETLSNLQK